MFATILGPLFHLWTYRVQQIIYSVIRFSLILFFFNSEIHCFEEVITSTELNKISSRNSSFRK